MKTAQLIVVGGPAKTGEYRINLPTVIGRGKSANLMVPHPLISRLHCRIYEENGDLYVKDLGSLNGTFVNNRRIDRDTAISPGDIIMVGDIQLEASYQASGRLAKPKASDTDIELTPGHQTQPIQETTIASIDLIRPATDSVFPNRDGQTVEIVMPVREEDGS